MHLMEILGHVGKFELLFFAYHSEVMNLRAAKTEPAGSLEVQRLTWRDDKKLESPDVFGMGNGYIKYVDVAMYSRYVKYTKTIQHTT